MEEHEIFKKPIPSILDELDKKIEDSSKSVIELVKKAQINAHKAFMETLEGGDKE